MASRRILKATPVFRKLSAADLHTIAHGRDSEAV